MQFKYLLEHAVQKYSQNIDKLTLWNTLGKLKNKKYFLIKTKNIWCL